MVIEETLLSSLSSKPIALGNKHMKNDMMET